MFKKWSILALAALAAGCWLASADSARAENREYEYQDPAAMVEKQREHEAAIEMERNRLNQAMEKDQARSLNKTGKVAKSKHKVKTHKKARAKKYTTRTVSGDSVYDQPWYPEYRAYRQSQQSYYDPYRNTRYDERYLSSPPIMHEGYYDSTYKNEYYRYNP